MRYALPLSAKKNKKVSSKEEQGEEIYYNGMEERWDIGYAAGCDIKGPAVTVRLNLDLLHGRGTY
jgi:hypothetical protein